MTQSERLQLISLLTEAATLVPVTETITVCRDPKDNKFLELAVSGQASYLISGDDDLLLLHPFRNIPIMTPQDFLKSIEQ